MISSNETHLKHKLLNKEEGLTLAEMLISMGLIGAVLIPMLFISSAVFLRQISDSRENVDVIQNASHVINILSNDLQKVHRILPGSSSSEVHYASYDARTGKEALRGFKITVVSGSNYKLERLDYNTTTDAWVAKSPYGPLAADDITLQKTGGGAPTFGYCLDITCTGQTSVSASPENTVLLQLDDWVFTRGSDSSSITLPDVNIHLASDSSVGGYLLSEGVRELYTIDTSIASSAGSGAALSSLSLTPGGGQFNYPDAGWTLGSSGALSTIIFGASTTGIGHATVPNAPTVAGSPIDERVFIGSNDGSGEFFTWKDNVLSTLVSGQDNPGFEATVVDSTGRAFFAEFITTGSIWSWKDNVLSTIIPSAYHLGTGALHVAADDSLFIGSRAGNGNLLRWKDNVLSTLTSALNTLPGYHAIAEAPDGRIYFGSGDSTNSKTWTWKDDVLSTITNGGEGFVSTGVNSSLVDPTDGRYFFGTGHSSPTNPCTTGAASTGPYLTWKDNVLSTIVSSEHAPGCSNSAVASDGRVYFGELVSPGSFWTWKDNVLSTITSSTWPPGQGGSVVTGSDNGVYFANGTHILKWKDNILSTLNGSSITNVGYEALAISTVDDRVFFGGQSPNYLWTWKDNVLSTLITAAPITHAGRKSLIVNAYGRAFFGDQHGSQSKFWTWHESTGLSTIVPTNANKYGDQYMRAVSPFNGRVYLGYATGTAFWTWHDGTTPGGGNVIRLDNSGNKNNQDVTVAAASTYDLSAQDIDGEFYFMNATDGELHRYTWAGGTSSYTIATSFTMGGFASDVVAMAIDQAEDTIAFLDKDSTQPNIQIYDNRKASSTPTLTTKTLGALGSKEPDSPTGMAINGRTGDFLIIDSDQKGSNPNYYVNLLVIDPTVSRVKKTFKIYTKNTNTKIPISTDLSAETNFKIHYDDAKNIVYLVSPSTEKIIPMTLPEFLE